VAAVAADAIGLTRVFEKLRERAERLGEARAARARERLAERLREVGRGGVEIFEADEAVVVQARAGRLSGDTALHWLVAEARNDG
jgi:hypothetical protein